MSRRTRREVSRVEWLHILVMFIALVQFSAAWLYPPKKGFGGVENLQLNKPGGVPFQYLLWLSILGMIARELAVNSSERLVTVLKPILPLAAIGMISTLIGFDPATSFRMYFLWFAMLSCATVIGIVVSSDNAELALLTCFAILVGLSLFVVVAIPEIGTQADRDARAWRGLFIGKNIFGWFGSIGLVVGLGFVRPGRRLLGYGLAVGGALCVLGSGSKGALVMALSGAGYRLLLPLLASRFKADLAFVILLISFLLSALASQVLMPFVLEALGRDPSLTGRTDIWAAYFESMLRSPWIGSGPGAYTGMSPFTAVLAARLIAFGAILTPHNMYLGAFGDSGGIGLLVYVITLGYFVFVVPLRSPTRSGYTCASIGFLVMIAGFVETHEIFNAGIGGYCLMLTYSMTVSAARHAHDNRITQVADAATGGNSAGI